MIRRIVLAAFCGMFLFNLNAVAATWGECKAYDEYLENRESRKCALCNASTDGYYACVYGRVQVRGWGGFQGENYCFRCDKGTIDATWEKSGPITNCAHDPLRGKPHTRVKAHDPNRNKNYLIGNAHWVGSFGAQKLCYVYDCETDYKNVNGECVPKNGDSGGSSSVGGGSGGGGGRVGGGSSGGGGRVGGGSSGGGGHVGGGFGGITVDTGAMDKCTSTGGKWIKKSKTCECDKTNHLVYNGAIKGCACDIGYMRDIQTNRCVATSQTQCEHVGPSVANWIDGKCVCVDTDKIWSSNGCIVNPDKIMCDRISGAKWTGTECKCTIAGYVVNKARTQCVKSDELIKTEGQAASRATITSVYKKLNAMSDDFKVSVWKNADGNFNTARLASDSIAAVVLGTTGALVTSNIVKKNQVSGGFEDINCQVGGQTVAGWGDQFSVGIQ